jgi:hypothetical protein
MKTFRVEGEDMRMLRSIAMALRDNNHRLAEYGKAADAAKKQLAKWLKENRECDVETLVVGDIVQIEDVVMIEVSGQMKFDQSGFRLAEPASFEKWQKEMAIRKFKPLV